MFRLPKLQVNSLGSRPSSRSVMTSHLLSLRGNLRKQEIQEDSQDVSAFGPFLRPPSSTSFLHYDHVDVGKKKSAPEISVKSPLDEAFGINCGNKFHPLLLTPHNKLSMLADILQDNEYLSPNSTLITDLKVRRKIVIQDDYQDIFAQFKNVSKDEQKTKDTSTGIKPLDLENILSKNKPIKKLSPIDEEDAWTRFHQRSRELKRINSKSTTDLVPKSLKLQTEAEKEIEELKREAQKPRKLKFKDFQPFMITLNRNKPIESLEKIPTRDSGTENDQTIHKPSPKSLKKVLKIPLKTKTNLKYVPMKEMPALPPSAVSVPLSRSQKKIVIPDLPERPKKILVTETKAPTVPFSSTGTAKQIQKKSSKKQIHVFEMKLPRIVRSQEAIDKNGIFSLKSILRAQQSNSTLKRN